MEESGPATSPVVELRELPRANHSSQFALTNEDTTSDVNMSTIMRTLRNLRRIGFKVSIETRLEGPR